MGLKSATGTYLSGNTASEFDPAAHRGEAAWPIRCARRDQIGAILESGSCLCRRIEIVSTWPEGIGRYAEAVPFARCSGAQPVVTVPVKRCCIPMRSSDRGHREPGAGKKETAGVVFLPACTGRRPGKNHRRQRRGGADAPSSKAGRMLRRSASADRVVMPGYITPAALSTYKGRARAEGSSRSVYRARPSSCRAWFIQR
jgi:hypothetical protein